MPKLLIHILYAVATSYVVFVAGLYLLQRQMLYFPSSAPVTVTAADMPRVQRFPVTTPDGLSLDAFYSPAEGGKPTLVYFHGNGGDALSSSHFMRFFAERGYGVALGVYRGYTGNPGQPTEQGIYRDGRALLEALKAQGVTPEQVVLFGESLGSGVAVQLATEYPVRAVVLNAPFLSIRQVARERYPLAPGHWLVRDPWDNAAKVKAVKAPLLILHGARDAVIPVHHGRGLFALANQPKRYWEVPDGGHNDLPVWGSAQRVLEFVDGLPYRR